MNVLYWNACGLANADTQRALKKLVRENNPLVVCLSEPFVSPDAIPFSFWRTLNLHMFATNNRGEQDPNLWFLCHVDLKPILLSSTDQQITVSCSLDGVQCCITAVYAKTTIRGRRQLWHDLNIIHSSQAHNPWLVLGDFNCVLGAHEKRGGNIPSATACREFQQMCTACELLNIDTKGLFFTWSNRRTDIRLDRALGNAEWFDAWNNFECRSLTKASSDHCPIMVSCSRIPHLVRPLFRFQNMWLQHPDFLHLVREFWENSTYHGCPMFILSAKLRALKVVLRQWNASHFGDINNRVHLAKVELDGIQQDISSLGPSEERYRQEDKAHADYQLALSMQDSFLRSKSRVRWLVDGDRNTSFLHNMVKIRKVHRSMATIKVGSQVLQSHDQIASHVVQHFSSLFTKDESITNTGLVERVIPALVTEEENLMLAASPSIEEIRGAVMGMDGFSAPGPDGFGGSFF
ncbi:uncharacterized protein LOC133725310 [Rosa rugosa]|uniref:uncharacterized protein LOC133725310 n=1 Tax=Rosa rugosa TaxID=74645 RepID=UPI002B4068EE|nr:uncharacterized protein LOC133725310 [Rosa rugosa]